MNTNDNYASSKALSKYRMAVLRGMVLTLHTGVAISFHDRGGGADEIRYLLEYFEGYYCEGAK